MHDTASYSNMTKDDLRLKILRTLGRDQKPRNEKQLKCSFCGKSAAEVEHMLSGPSVYICDKCVTKCNQILDDQH